MTNALTVNHVGKAYKRYFNKWARAWEWVSRRSRHEKTWVLKDIDFSVKPGEAVGIIGVNGAGKSTLLKIITGTTQPTTGQVHTSGRVAALLELGMGFHPDFTGRQNVSMAGQLLGLSQAEISAHMPAIEAFAEIGEYIDRPVRLYSSGMQMRLAFSVATAVRPDLLIVDEALSVGDAYFQHKSFNKIREFREKGTSLLIVSHDRSAIQNLCDRAILLERGNIIRDGSPEEVMDFYNAKIAERENSKILVNKLENGKSQIISGNGEAVVTEIYIEDEEGKQIEYVDVGQPITLCLRVEARESIDRLVLGYGIKDRLGQVIFGTNTDLKQQVLKDVKSGDVIDFRIHFPANLGPGSYSIQTALCSAETHLLNNYEWRDLALMFDVINVNKASFAGCAWIDPTIDIRKS